MIGNQALNIWSLAFFFWLICGKVFRDIINLKSWAIQHHRTPIIPSITTYSKWWDWFNHGKWQIFNENVGDLRCRCSLCSRSPFMIKWIKWMCYRTRPGSGSLHGNDLFGFNQSKIYEQGETVTIFFGGSALTEGCQSYINVTSSL